MKAEIGAIIRIIIGLGGLSGIIYLNGVLSIGVGNSIETYLIAFLMSIGLIISGFLFFAGITGLYSCNKMDKELKREFYKTEEQLKNKKEQENEWTISRNRQRFQERRKGKNGGKEWLKENVQFVKEK